MLHTVRGRSKNLAYIGDPAFLEKLVAKQLVFGSDVFNREIDEFDRELDHASGVHPCEWKCSEAGRGPVGILTVPNCPQICRSRPQANSGSN
jgi:hypothetical protein